MRIDVGAKDPAARVPTLGADNPLEQNAALPVDVLAVRFSPFSLASISLVNLDDPSVGGDGCKAVLRQAQHAWQRSPCPVHTSKKMSQHFPTCLAPTDGI